MREVNLGTVTLGCGPVKVAVPLVGSDWAALQAELNALPDSSADLAEWRIDCLMPFPDTAQLLVLARQLKQRLGNCPLLITFRSLSEGGRLPLDVAAYREFQLRLAKEQLPDLLDVELFSGLPNPSTHIAALQREHIPVIASRHFFAGTPAQPVMRASFQAMRESNADILKLAVMTQSPEDLLSLLQFSAVWKQEADRPFVLIGMGPHGVLSRISGAEFGSCLSFGALCNSSAPGQLPARDLKRILSLLPEYPVSQTAEPRK